jgi:putative heme transporter
VSVASGTVLAGIIGAVVAVPMVAVAWATFAQLRAMSAVDDAEPETPDPREADPPPPETPVNPPTVL